MRSLFLLLIAVWVISACAGCGPAQAEPLPTVVSSAAASETPDVTPTSTIVADPTRTPLATLTPVFVSSVPGLFVDAASSRGPISPYVYGTNYGPWLFLTLEMKPEVQKLNLSIVRWPGGNWGDLNDLDAWQLDTFLSFCREMKLEPAISVRLKGGSPEQAAAVVRYIKDRGEKVRFWSIGNEPNLYPEYDTERYNREWRVFAAAMRAVDPNLQLIGPDTNQFSADLEKNPKDKQGRDWLDEFLKANGDMVDIVAIHRYPFPKDGSTTPTKADLRANSKEWDDIVPALRASVRQYTRRDLPVAVTEVNSSWAINSGGEATLDSHYNAIWWGDSLGRMIRQGTEMVNQFALVGEYGLTAKYNVYPIYYVYRMYALFGTERLLAASDNADVSVFAARRPDGALTVMLVNLSSQVIEMPFHVQGAGGVQVVETWLFDPQHDAELVKTEPFFHNDMMKLPAESMLLVVLR